MKKILFLCFVVISMGMIAQTTPVSKGNSFYEKQDYFNAAIEFTKEAQSNPTLYLKLAKSYFALQKFDEAKEAIQNYKSKASGADTKYADEFLAMLDRMDDAVVVSNLGSTINTSKGEYFPQISKDGKTLYFTSWDRSGGLGGEDIWSSNRKEDGTWTEPKAFNQINTTSHEDIMSLSADNNVAILFGNYQGSFGSGDLFYSVNTPAGWTTPCNLGGAINTANWESQASLGPDGKTLLFVSNRPGGEGGQDIYVSFLTENGWTAPKNLGSQINTSSREYSPMLAADGKTLYFSTNGRFSFGGTDLYVSKRMDDSWTNWSTPVNLGRFINTLDDDAYMTIPASGAKAYMVRNNQPDGVGDADLYSFIIPPSMRPEPVFNVKGRVYNDQDSSVGAIIRFYDMQTGNEISQTISNRLTGQYFVSLPAFKKYKVVIDMKGYLYYEDTLDLADPNKYLRKDNISTLMASQMNALKKLKSDIDQHQIKLQALMDSKSDNVKESFEAYQNLLSEYNKAVSSMQDLVMAAKLEWLGADESERNLNRDYKIIQIRIGAKFELKNIFFDLGKATLRNESMAELEKLVSIMGRSEIVIELGGHSDDIGKDEDNLKLSQERVASVKAFLIQKGVTESRIAAVGYGETQPIADNKTDEGRQKNRRVEVKITEIKPREGSQIVTNKDSLRKENARFDILVALQYAAYLGGVPKGSSCSNEVTYMDNSKSKPKNYTYKNFDFNKFNDPNQKKQYSNFNFSSDPFEKDEFHLGSKNVFIGNYGFNLGDAKSRMIGGGFNSVELLKDRAKETYVAAYIPMGGDTANTVKFALNGGVLNTFPTRPFGWVLGVEGHISNVYTPLAKGVKFGITLPLGVRYYAKLKAAGGIVLVPELIYRGSLFTSKELKNAYGRYRHITLGINARRKNIFGGLFFVGGPFVRYTGLRAGISF